MSTLPLVPVSARARAAGYSAYRWMHMARSRVYSLLFRLLELPSRMIRKDLGFADGHPDGHGQADLHSRSPWPSGWRTNSPMAIRIGPNFGGNCAGGSLSCGSDARGNSTYCKQEEGLYTTFSFETHLRTRQTWVVMIKIILDTMTLLLRSQAAS